MNFLQDEKFKSINASAQDFISRSGLDYSSDNIVLLPAFCDVHVHFREPGFSYKETMQSGSMAAAHGGYTAVCTMPNLNPVPDCLEALKIQLETAKNNSLVRVYPYGAISKGEKGEALADIADMAPFTAGFSDDGKGLQSEEMMLLAMTEAKRLNKIIAAHCEDNSLLNGGCIHDGEYAKRNGYKGIGSASEYKQIERDIKLAEITGCPYHVCHISAKESVELIRKAKQKGIDITCETAPHYLILCDDDLQDDGRFKMNPPIRGSADRKALIEGIADGTIDMIATDHAPHSTDEKSRGLKDSLMGVVGLETAFAVLYTELVMKNVISLKRLVELLCVNPKRRFGIDTENDFTVFDLGARYKIDESFMLSKGKSTPFLGREVFGKCLLTVCKGNVVYKAEV